MGCDWLQTTLLNCSGTLRTRVNQCELINSDDKLQMLLKLFDSVFQDEPGKYSRNPVDLEIDPWSVPRIEGMFIGLADCQNFTEIELSCAYLPQMMSEVAQWYTTRSEHLELSIYKNALQHQYSTSCLLASHQVYTQEFQAPIGTS